MNHLTGKSPFPGDSRHRMFHNTESRGYVGTQAIEHPRRSGLKCVWWVDFMFLLQWVEGAHDGYCHCCGLYSLACL